MDVPPTDVTPKTRLLTDLPNEIQTQIFENVIPTGRQFGKNCIYVDLKGSTPEVEPGLEPVWVHPWVPNLRLICRSIRRLVTPIIGRHTQIHISRAPVRPWHYAEHKRAMSQEAVRVSRFCPKWMIDYVKRVLISDPPATTYLYPMTPIDVSGMPRLAYVAYSCFDPIESMAVLFSTASHFSPGKGAQRMHEVWKSMQESAPEDDSTDEIPIPRVIEEVGALMFLKCWVHAIVRKLFEDVERPDSYRATSRALCARLCKIERKNIIGLLPSTRLGLEVMDKANRQMTAFMSQNECEGTSKLITPSVARHKESFMLDVFELDGYGTAAIVTQSVSFESALHRMLVTACAQL